MTTKPIGLKLIADRNGEKYEKDFFYRQYKNEHDARNAVQAEMANALRYDAPAVNISTVVQTIWGVDNGQNEQSTESQETGRQDS